MQVGGRMRIDIERDGHRGVPEKFLDDNRMGAGAELEGRGGMPELMEHDAVQAGGFPDAGPFGIREPGTEDGATGPRWEDIALLARESRFEGCRSSETIWWSSAALA